MKTMELIEELEYAVVQAIVSGCSTDRVNAAKAALKSAFEDSVREVEYNQAHTLIKCPQCGCTVEREYYPLKD